MERSKGDRREKGRKGMEEGRRGEKKKGRGRGIMGGKERGRQDLYSGRSTGVCVCACARAPHLQTTCYL